MRVFQLGVVAAVIAIGCSWPDARAASMNPAPSTDSSLVARRLWAGGSFFGSISYDGMKIVYRNDSTIRVRTLSSGDDRVVKATHGDYNPVLSHDNARIAYDWAPAEGAREELHVMNADGTNERSFSACCAGGEIGVTDWSHDDKLVLFTLEDSAGQGVRALDVPSGAVRTIVAQTERYPEDPKFSPDSRFVAFDVDASLTDDDREIDIMDAGGTNNHMLVNTPGDDELLGFGRNGASIYYAATQNGSTTIYRQSVKNGQAVGKATVLRSGLPFIEPAGVTEDGLVYTANSYEQQLQVATIDVAAAKPLAPVSTIGTFTHTFVPPSLAWSNDGAYLVFSTIRFEPKRNSVFVHSIATGEQREFPLDVENIYGLRWGNHPDTILVDALQHNDSTWWSALSLTTGHVQRIPAPIGGARDATGHLFRLEMRKTGLTVLSGAGASARVVYTGSSIAHGSVASDGKRVVVSEPASHRMLMITTSSDAPQPLATYDSGSEWNGVGWTPDGQNLVYTLRATDGASQVELWTVDLNGRMRQIAQYPKIVFARLSPDGHHLAMTNRMDERGELWLLEDH